MDNSNTEECFDDNTQKKLQCIKEGLKKFESKFIRFYMPKTPGGEIVSCYRILFQIEGANKDIIQWTYFNPVTGFFYKEIKQMDNQDWYRKYKYANGI